MFQSSRLLLIGAVLVSPSVMAQVTPSYDIGTEFYHETYKETVNGQDFMKEEANMVGINGAVNLQFNARDAIKLSARYAKGQSDYTGAYQGQPYGSLTSSGQDRYVYDLRGVYAATGLVAGHDMTTSLGLGYRNLTDRLDQSGPGGYKRESEYFYATLGLESQFRLGNGAWSMTPKFAYDYLIEGTQHSYLGRSIGELKNTQKDGYGLEFSAAFTRALQNNHALVLSPFYRYWHIKDSDQTLFTSGGVQYVGIEPNNTTSEYGVNLTYRF